MSSIELDAESVEALVRDFPKAVRDVALEALAGTQQDLEILKRAADKAGQALLEIQELVEAGYVVENVAKQPSQSRTPRIEPQSDVNPYAHVVPGFGASILELVTLNARLKQRQVDEHHFD